MNGGGCDIMFFKENVIFLNACGIIIHATPDFNGVLTEPILMLGE